MRKVLLSSGMLALLAGCPYPQNTAPSDPAGRPINLALWVKAMPRRGEAFDASPSRALALRSGDRVAFDFTLSKSAYVYLGARSSDGSLALLFPRGAEQPQNPLPADIEHRAGIFKLDENVGQEDIFVYVSKKLLTREIVLDALRRDGNVVARQRGARSTPEDEGERETAPASPVARFQDLQDGMVRKHFVILHKK